MALCPVTFPTGDTAYKAVWQGYIVANVGAVVTVNETPAATGDGMSLRGQVTGITSANTGIGPKDSGWTATRTLYLSSSTGGGPVTGMIWTTAPGGPNTPGAISTFVTILVGMPGGNPTTWTMASASVTQSGVTVPETPLIIPPEPRSAAVYIG